MENRKLKAAPIVLDTFPSILPICSNLFDERTNFSIALTKVRIFPVTSDNVVAKVTKPLLSPNLENPRNISFIINTAIRPTVTIILNTFDRVLPR